ncbi:MAG: hypothetical protein C5B50_23365 [Verrucomicrobia bacterium]|nr:MAG: hypothetical protein C5B50_23365 [Verrucomicrobiota bacterium]
MASGLIGGLGFIGLAFGAAAETNKSAASPPLTNRAKASTNAPAMFRVKSGFRFEVVAEAPMVAAPVAMAFDENGRLFVAEMRDYPDQRSKSPHLGEISVLEDTTGQGVFDSSNVYADDLASPSAVACYDGGVFVGATTELIYLKDAGRNGNAEVRKVVSNGLGAVRQSGAEVFLNNFNWGLDSRIHGGAGPLSPTGENLAEVRDLLWDPRTLKVSPETGIATSGLSFDSFGRKFVCDADHPLRMAMFELRCAARNPFFVKPPVLADAEEGARTGASARFGVATSRLTRTRVRAGLAESAAPEARGLVVYRGSGFPTNYYENIFIADPGRHAIYRVVVAERGLEMVCASGLEEFVSSTDSTFRPMQIVNGPDGALYVADMRGGGESGRIFRLAPEKFKASKAPQLGNARLYDLVAALAHPDGWRQDTAARLLYERHDRAAVPLLANMAQKAQAPSARVHALRTLQSLDGLSEPVILTALRDPDARVRENAVLAAEAVLKTGAGTDALWNQFKRTVADPVIRVRYQLAFTLGESRDPRRISLLAAILKRDSGSEWMRAAVLSSLGEGGGALFALMAGDADYRATPAGQDLLHELAAMLGVQGFGPEINLVTGAVEGGGLDISASFSLLSSVGEGLRRARSSLSVLDSEGRLQGAYSQALNIVVAGGTSMQESVEALRLLGCSPYAYDQLSGWLLLIPGNNYSSAVQSAAIETLARFNDPRIVPSLLTRWPYLTSQLRRVASAALLSRIERVRPVAAALQDGKLEPGDLSPAHANMLRTWPDPAMAEIAVHVLGPLARRRAEEVRRFQPALRLQGVPDRGRQIFLNRCASCHGSAVPARATLSGAAGFSGSPLWPLGPDLMGARRRGKERILEAVLEPHNKAVPGYTTSVVEAKDGELLVGLVKDENQRSITLQQPDGTMTIWARESIASIRPQTWSLMPVGLEEGLSNQDMADLIEYVTANP